MSFMIKMFFESSTELSSLVPRCAALREDSFIEEFISFALRFHPYNVIVNHSREKMTHIM